MTLFSIQRQVKIALPRPHALAQTAQANGPAHRKIRRQGYLNSFEFCLKPLADLQAHTATRRKIACGQGKALFLVNLAA